MKTLIKSGIMSIMLAFILPISFAQVSVIGNYTGSLPKIDFSASIDLERTVNLTIGTKTITGTVSLKCIFPDADEYINTIKVNLKGDGVDIQTTTISCRTDYRDASYIKYSYIFDFFAGTINGKQISGYIGKQFNDKLFGSVSIGDKEMFIVKKSRLNNYQLSYGDVLIGVESKGGMNKQGFPKIPYDMTIGSKSFSGIINHNGDLKNKKIDYTYELSTVDLNDEEIGLWAFVFFSSEVLSGRTEVYR